MNYLFFGFLAVCVLGIVCMFLAFCYNQDKLKASFRNKTDVSKDKLSSELAIDIDKDKKENNQ